MSSRKLEVLVPEPINLINNTTGSDDERSNEVYINKISVGDCSVINTDNGNKFVVWKISVIAKNEYRNMELTILRYKRYSEFVKLRMLMIDELNSVHNGNPTSIAAMPKLPQNVPWYNKWRYTEVNLNKGWLNKRRQGLEYFINFIISNSDIMDDCKMIIFKFLDINQRR